MKIWAFARTFFYFVSNTFMDIHEFVFHLHSVFGFICNIGSTIQWSCDDGLPLNWWFLLLLILQVQQSQIFDFFKLAWFVSYECAKSLGIHCEILQIQYSYVTCAYESPNYQYKYCNEHLLISRAKSLKIVNDFSTTIWLSQATFTLQIPFFMVFLHVPFALFTCLWLSPSCSF